MDTGNLGLTGEQENNDIGNKIAVFLKGKHGSLISENRKEGESIYA